MYGPNIFPAVVINNQTFRGQLEIEAVFNGICSGFLRTPKYCKKYLNTNDINKDDLILMIPAHGFYPYLRVLRIVVLMMVLFGFMLFCYRRSVKRAMKIEMKQQVESAVNQYLALSNKDKEAGDRAMRSEMYTKN
jgi:hypothetical protein